MITLPSQVITALGATSRRPSIRLTVARDRFPTYALFANGSVTGGQFHNAVVIASDGSIVRAYLQNTAPTVAQVWIQRVTSPGTASQWTTWATLGSADKLTVAGIALARYGTTLRCFCCRGSDSAIMISSSTDNGATWSAFTLLATVGASDTIRGMAASSDTAGSNNALLICNRDDGSLSSTALHVAYMLYTGGVGWGPYSTSTIAGTPSAAGCALTQTTTNHWALAVASYGVSRQSGGGLAIATYTYDGTTWTQVGVPVPNDQSAWGVSVQWPHLRYDGTTYVLTYTEQDQGAFTGLVYGHTVVTQSIDFVHWDEGTEFVAPLQQGSPVQGVYERPTLVSGGVSYVMDNQQVYSAPAPPAVLDVTGAVLRYVFSRDAETPARLQFTLDNIGNPWVGNAAWGPNSRVTLEEGYYDPTGVAYRVVSSSQLLIQRWFVRRGASPSQPQHELDVEAEDIIGKLNRESRHQWLWSGQTVGWLVTEIATRAGIVSVTLPATAQFSEVIGNVRLAGGVHWTAALERILGIYTSWYRATPAGGLLVQEFAPSDPVVWTFATADLEGSTWGSVADRDNLVRAYAKPPAGAATMAVGEAWDYNHVALTGEVRYRHVVEQLASTQVQAQRRAGFELADRQRKASLHAITVALNPGPEVYDVVSVSDAAAGVSGAFRIMGAVSSYDAASATCTSRFLLEGV